ncbi:hypothetical protein DV735_g4526, partial [Chaetothyriales sp. CBS 134920]
MASSGSSDIVPALTRGNSTASSTSSAQTSMASSVIGEGFILESHDGILTLPDRYQIDADLVCPFQILDCERVFADVRHFKVHVFSHFKGHELPTTASCFLCDRKFANGPEDDAAQAWNAMLSHLANDHYRRGQRLATMRTDFELMRWMYVRRLISDHQFKRLQLVPLPMLLPGEGGRADEIVNAPIVPHAPSADPPERLMAPIWLSVGQYSEAFTMNAGRRADRRQRDATRTMIRRRSLITAALFGIERYGNHSMSVGEIFADAQRSNIGHKTLAKRLHRLENNAGFDVQIKQCISRLLEVSKSEVAGQRVVKFITVYFQDGDGSNPTTTAVLLNLLPYTCAKDRTVRYRATQLVAQILAVLSSIDDDLYRMIRHELIKRLYDKVPAIRLEAAETAAAPSLLEKLFDVLQNDSNADVRRKLLLTLPITPNTLPYLLERARDKDAPTRRALYSRLLPKLGDFRHLSVSMREKLLRWGLRDRDELVRKATARLFSERWIEDSLDDKNKIHAASIPALLELLERVDIMNCGAENGVGTDAMREFWKARPDYVDAVSFEDDFWDKLSPESAFMARTFITFVCQSEAGQRAREEDRIPEQEFIVEQLLHIAHELDYTDEIGRRKMFTLLREAISAADLPEEITRLAVEGLRLVCNPNAAGEREFTSVILEAIAEVHDTILPPTPANGDEGSQADNEDNDNAEDGEEDSFVSARSEVSSGREGGPKSSRKDGRPPPQPHQQLQRELSAEEEEQKAVKTIMVNLKCLHIAQCMLQNVRGPLQGNVHLESMLNNLVIPAIRSYELPDDGRGGDVDVDISPFVRALQMDDEDVQKVATESLAKLMLCGFYPANEDAFDDAIVHASQSMAKGWELLDKARAAVQTDKDKVERDKVRQSE